MTMTTLNTSARTFTTQRPSVVRMVKLAVSAHRQRRALRKLDNAALNDLGLTYDQAKREAKRPFWDVPATWRR